MTYTTKRALKKHVESLETALSQATALLAEIIFANEMDEFDASLKKKPAKKTVAKKTAAKKVAKKASTKK